jgi:serine/threonine protein kinase
VAEYPKAESQKRLDYEYSLREELDPAWGARPIAMARHWERTVLVLEDPGGVPLDQLLGHPLDLAFSLRLAISLSSAIDQLHQRDIIHKDIKPANVLMNSATGRCWLTGFGIASRLPRERQAPEPPEFVSGTLAYMAPEQTGRMNRSIDSRSDLYSFGVTLYEVLTGSLPFTASDPMEWGALSHCKAASLPQRAVENCPGNCLRNHHEAAR